MEPGYGPGYYSLGLLYAETGEMEEAIQYLNKTIDVDPDNIRAYYNLGLAYQQSGASQKAESIFRKGLDIKNDDPDLAYALVILYVQQGAFQKADLLMPLLKKAFPNEPEVLQLEEHIRQGMMAN